MWFDIFCNNWACSYHSEFAYGYAANDGGICADACALFYYSFSESICPITLGSWKHIIGGDYVWADEYIIFDGESFVDEAMVLNFAIVSYDDVWAYVYAFAYDAVGSYDGIFADVWECPYFGIFSYIGGVSIYDGGWVDCCHSVISEGFDYFFIIETLWWVKVAFLARVA